MQKNMCTTAQQYYSAPKQDDIIHVVLLVYDPSGTYSQHAGVVMTSIFENTASKVTVHILHDETLTDTNRQRLIRTAEMHSQQLDLIDISEQKKHFTDTATDLARRKCTIGSLYRFFVPEVLDLHKVIYLDCDVVVNLDIKEMWDIDIEDYCLAGAHSKDFEKPSETLRDWLNGSSSKTFINAGVMIMNLDKMREHGNLFKNAMLLIERLVHYRLKYNNSNPKIGEDIADSVIHAHHPIYGFKT